MKSKTKKNMKKKILGPDSVCGCKILITLSEMRKKIVINILRTPHFSMKFHLRIMFRIFFGEGPILQIFQPKNISLMARSP